MALRTFGIRFFNRGFPCPAGRGSTRDENDALVAKSRDGPTPEFIWCDEPVPRIGVALPYHRTVREAQAAT